MIHTDSSSTLLLHDASWWPDSPVHYAELHATETIILLRHFSAAIAAAEVLRVHDDGCPKGSFYREQQQQ